MPGKHDQSTHGHGHGQYTPGKDLLAGGNSEALAAEIDAEAARHATAMGHDFSLGHIGPNGDEQLAALAKKQGFDGKPDVVNSKDMDQLVADGRHTEIFRGVTGVKGKSAAALVEQFRTGDYYAGLGIHGSGTYTSHDRKTAFQFAGSKKQGVLRAAIRPEAKVIGYDELYKGYKAHYDSLPEGSVARRVWSDPGIYAAARGYDAIRVVQVNRLTQQVDRPDWFIILNRTAVIAEDA